MAEAASLRQTEKLGQSLKSMSTNCPDGLMIASPP